MKIRELLEAKAPKTRNPVAKAAQKVAKGSGAHKDKKRAEKQGEVKHKKDAVPVDESATAGATSAGNIASVEAPHISPGKARGKKSYLGDPKTGQSGTKSPPQPKVKQPKNPDGTVKGAHEIKSASLFGGPPVKR